MDEPDQPADEPDRSSSAAPARPAIALDLLDPKRLLEAHELRWLREHAELALREVARRSGRSGELRVRVVDDAEMAAAHERYSGVPGTTDVLTFDLAQDQDQDQGRALDADALVCADAAARQARARAHPRERELLLYVLHGALHAIGHDDTDDAGYARMHALEDEILESIGVGATFNVSPAGGSDSNGGPR